jgi:hypothetical protein
LNCQTPSVFQQIIDGVDQSYYIVNVKYNKYLQGRGVNDWNGLTLYFDYDSSSSSPPQNPDFKWKFTSYPNSTGLSRFLVSGTGGVMDCTASDQNPPSTCISPYGGSNVMASGAHPFTIIPIDWEKGTCKLKSSNTNSIISIWDYNGIYAWPQGGSLANPDTSHDSDANTVWQIIPAK